MDESGLQLLIAELRSEIAELRAQNRALIDALGRVGTAKAAPSITVAALYEHYEKACSVKHSWRMEQDKLAPTVRLLGSLPAEQVTPQRWEKHRQVRRTEPIAEGRRNAGRPPAEATLNVELGVAKNMLEWGVEQGYLDHNPLRPTRYGKTKGARKTWIPEPELQRLLDAPKPHGHEQRAALHAWLLTKADTGLRFSEARRIRRDRLRRTPEGWVLDIDTTKGGKAHTVGVTPRMLAAYDALPRVIGSPYFLVRPATGRLYGEQTIYTWFREACLSCDLDSIVVEGEVRVRPHDLRRSAATKANEEGASLFEIQAMLNHSNPATTAKYIQRTPTSAVRMAKVLAAVSERERKGPRPAEKQPPEATNTAKGQA